MTEKKEQLKESIKMVKENFKEISRVKEKHLQTMATIAGELSGWNMASPLISFIFKKKVAKVVDALKDLYDVVHDLQIKEYDINNVKEYAITYLGDPITSLSDYKNCIEIYQNKILAITNKIKISYNLKCQINDFLKFLKIQE